MVLPQKQVRVELLIELDVMGERHTIEERGERLFLVRFTPLPVPKPNGLQALILQWVFYPLNLSPFPPGMPWFSSAFIMSPGPLQQSIFPFASNVSSMLLTE